MRNRIVHAHPSKIVGLTSKDGALIDRLRSQRLTASSSTNTLHHFMSAHVARFACNAARAMIRDLARDQPMDGITDGQVLLILPPALASGPDMSKLDVMFPALPDLPAPTDPCVTLGRGAIDIDLLEVEARQTPDLPT